jgi:hypothetical protein
MIFGCARVVAVKRAAGKTNESRKLAQESLARPLAICCRKKSATLNSVNWQMMLNVF